VIALIVFYLHVVAFAYVFAKRYQEEGLGEGFLGVFFMGLIFFVGWSISSFIMKLFMEQEGWAIWFDRDAASLAFLTITEAMFYYFYFREEPGDDDTVR
jgi:hypothetical protein